MSNGDFFSFISEADLFRRERTVNWIHKKQNSTKKKKPQNDHNNKKLVRFSIFDDLKSSVMGNWILGGSANTADGLMGLKAASKSEVK